MVASSSYGAMTKPEDSNGEKKSSFGDKMKHLKEKLKDSHLHDAKVALIHKKFDPQPPPPGMTCISC